MASFCHWSSLLPPLPFELVEEILYKIPVGSLARFKSVSKQWYALLNDERFIYKHLLGLPQEGFIRLSHESYRIFIPETKTLLRRKIPYDLRWISHISTMIHCDGLLLCKCSDSKLAVWNPCLSQVTWIRPSPSHGFDKGRVCGFGYGNASPRSYKILRFHAAYTNQGNKSSKVEIYDFNSKLWTSVVDANFDVDWSFDSRHQDVPMNGNMYWIAYRRRSTGTEFFIQSFDFSTETFKPICCVPFENRRFHDAAFLSVFEGDRLSLLHENEHVGIEVWVTNKVVTDDDEVVSWSNYFNVARPAIPVLKSSFRRTVLTYFIHDKTNNIMLWYEEEDVKERYVNVYEISEGEIRKQVETGRHRHRLFDTLPNRCYVYAPSLVPVP